MKTLLEFFIENFGFLYVDPRYRITDSVTSGISTINAGLNLTGPLLSWSIDNDRGILGFAVAPTELAGAPDNWFGISVIRQHLDDYDELNRAGPAEMATWTRTNLSRIEEMFSSANAQRSCEVLIARRKAQAYKYFGPPIT
ncbi:hypothetical protein DQP58_17295 [Mycobacterium colombiense]|uniref:Uncharacterized protein n=1 Tax=Mycobacterium colombiense TaxID=339268 RepID=A0A329KDD6_9MYCO|nr:hypothetical protein [Mycobacterium colombiense]RAU93025.1 hypothetical protein DQP58_17295 [Mycobacterium colombiense]